MLELNLNDRVSVRSPYTSREIKGGAGVVTRVCKRYVLVTCDAFARPVKFRTQAPLCGVRIIGGLVEYLNEYIVKA